MTSHYKKGQSSNRDSGGNRTKAASSSKQASRNSGSDSSDSDNNSSAGASSSPKSRTRKKSSKDAPAPKDDDEEEVAPAIANRNRNRRSTSSSSSGSSSDSGTTETKQSKPAAAKSGKTKEPSTSKVGKKAATSKKSGKASIKSKKKDDDTGDTETAAESTKKKQKKVRKAPGDDDDDNNTALPPFNPEDTPFAGGSVTPPPRQRSASTGLSASSLVAVSFAAVVPSITSKSNSVKVSRSSSLKVKADKNDKKDKKNSKDIAKRLDMEDIKHVVAIEVEKQVQERLALQRSEFEARILQEKNELEKAKNDLKQATEATVNDQKARRNEHGENLDISEPITKKPRITASRLDTLIGMNPCPIGTPFDIHKDSVLRFYNTVKQGCREEMRTDEDSKEKNTSRASPVGQSVAPAAVGKQSLFNCKESWNSVANQHAMKVSMQRLKEKYVTFKMDDDFIKEQLKTTHKGKWDNYRKVQKVTVARDTEIAMTIGDQSAREEKKNTLQVVANTAQKNVSQRSRHAAACRRKATNRRAAAAKAHEMHAKICGMSMKDPANLSLIDNALIPGAMSSDDSEQDVDGKTIGYKRTILVARSDELTKCIEALDVIYKDMLKEKKKDKSAVRLTRRRTDDPRKSERKIKSKRGHHPWILKTKPDPYIAPPQLAQFSAIASAH